MSYIPMEQCKNGYLYRIHSRNLAYGVYREKVQGFIGIREKFGHEYLFTEFHWDTGEPFGTVQPAREIEPCPSDIELTEHYDTIDSKTGRKVLHETKVDGKGRGWFFVDTGETSNDINPVSPENEKLFKWLEEKEKQYGYDD